MPPVNQHIERENRNEERESADMQLPRKADFPCRYILVAAVQRLVRVKLAASRYNSHTHHSEVSEQAGWSGAGWHSYSCLNVLMRCVCAISVCLYARLFRVGECVCVCSVILVTILKYDSCGGSARFTPFLSPFHPPTLYFHKKPA